MKRLDELITSYHIFQPNQLLLSEQLNNIVDYLEQQERLTRQKLIGIGIVCGLEATKGSSDGEYSVHITRGVGVTSEGWLIVLPEDKNCTLASNVTIGKEEYPPLAGIKEIKEIFDETEPHIPVNTEKLTERDLEDKVVVLYLEVADRDVAKCVVNDCDERGKIRQLRVRKLLIDEGYFTDGRYRRRTIRRTVRRVPQGVCGVRHMISELLEVEIPRFLPSNMKTDSVSAFVEAYTAVILEGARRLKEAFIRLQMLFENAFLTHLLERERGLFKKLANTLDRLIEFVKGSPDGIQYSVQYIYDYLRDIKKAYDELVSELSKLSAQCSPPTGLFPQHLVLGRLREKHPTIFDPSAYRKETADTLRTCFIPSPVHNNQAEVFASIRQLIERLRLIVGSFTLEDLFDKSMPVRIIPTVDCSSELGRQAIPFYYSKKHVRKLASLWNFEATITDSVEERVRGYHLIEEGRNPLMVDLCGYPKLRIEGHVGKSVDIAVEELKELRSRYNLDFDILTLKLDGAPNRVYLPDDTKIADLQTLYSIERNRLVCCIEDMLELIREQKENISLIMRYFAYNRARSTEGTLSSNAMYKTTYETIKTRFETLYSRLAQYVAVLPPHIKDFNMSALNLCHCDIDSLCMELKQYVRGEAPASVSSREETATSGTIGIINSSIPPVVNTFETFLDTIRDRCLLASFGSILKGFLERVKTISLFSGFNTAVPGMEHIAGTMWGGTFILVYEEVTRKKQVTLVTTSRRKPLANVEYRVFAVKDNRPERLIKSGRTDSRGEARFEMPLIPAVVFFYKQGYEPRRLELPKTQKVLKVELDRERQVEGPQGIRPRIVYYYREPFSLMMATPLLMEVLDTTEHYGKIEFATGEDFIVVADFYLPCKIRDSHLEMPEVPARMRVHSMRNLSTRIETIADAVKRFFKEEKKKRNDTLINRVLRRDSSGELNLLR